MTDIEAIVAEIEEELGLSKADAMRILFVTLALKSGWSNASISRYLGISRARVGQKVERTRFYLANHKLPKLKKAVKSIKIKEHESSRIAFSAESWQDPDFALGVLSLLLPARKVG